MFQRLSFRYLAMISLFRFSESAATPVITLENALTTARQSLATVAERAERHGYYSGARTEIINSHAELRAALDMLVKAAEHTESAPSGIPESIKA